MVPVEVDQALNLPDEAAIQHLLSLPENQWFERKSGAIKPMDLAVPLVAMANAEGGVIAVGLADGKVSPVSDKAANALRQSAIDFTMPTVPTQIRELFTPEGRVMVLLVAPSDAVHETRKGECYQRIGDESRRLSFAQRQNLEWDRGSAKFDGSPVSDFNIEDLDDGALSAFQTKLGSSSPQLALQARNLVLNDGRLTVAACLLFARNPQMVFPNAHIRILKYDNNERGQGRLQNLVEGADIRCEGTIPTQIDSAISHIGALIPKRRALGTGARFEAMDYIPRAAWIEGLVNAVVHRSYNMSGDHIRVEIFPNRMEITNPGRFLGTADLSNPEGIMRHARNPRIARVCADLGITEELGEGIRRIYQETRNAELNPPTYEHHPDAVRLILHATRTTSGAKGSKLTPNALIILEAMRSAQRPLSTGQIVELVDLTRPTVLRILRQLQSEGRVHWSGTSPRDPQATWHL